MKTKKQVIADYPEFKPLINAVIRQLGGMEQMENIVAHPDASAGWPGFIYYSDTHAFAMKNRQQIIKLLEYSADQLGEEVTSMVRDFGVFRGEMEPEEVKSLYKYLGGGKCEQDNVTNVMAWFALEEVARMFDN